MQSVDAKAKVVCHKLGLPDDGQAFSTIRFALKEQDRDTRHACAEASLQCGTVKGAHDACMNAKAV
jgi:hypothetical protein